jgi:hypothetical protein
MRRLAGLSVAVGLVLAACGSSKSSTTATTAATTATTGLGITSTTTPNFSGSKNSKFCDVARQFSEIDVSKLGGDLKPLFAKFDSLGPQLVSSAPSDIKADANTVVVAITQLETAFKAVNYDATKLDPASVALVQDPKFSASISRIDAYTTQVCGITTSTT